MPIVPKIERANRIGRFFLWKENFSSERSSITKAKINATRLRKKLFCMDGRSPDSLTNRFIKAKKKADIRMNKMPLLF